MAHSKREELTDCELLLEKIRALPALKEKSFGCFYFKGKGVLHFHQVKERRYVHVSDGKNWHEVDIVAPASKNTNLLAYKKIAKLISPLLG
jgi:hypothetical protein